MGADYPENLRTRIEGVGAGGFGQSVSLSTIGVAGRPRAGGDGTVTAFRAGEYERWAASIELTTGRWRPHDDFDRDGQNNLIEFALGSDPFVLDHARFEMVPSNIFANSPTEILVGEPVTFSFVMPELAYPTFSVVPLIQSSRDLGSWFYSEPEIRGDFNQTRTVVLIERNLFIGIGGGGEEYDTTRRIRHRFYRFTPTYPAAGNPVSIAFGEF